MSVLSRTEILAAIESGDIKIDPFDPNSVLAIDAPDPRTHALAGILRVVEEVDYRDITEKVTLQEGDSFLLLPNTACIGITKETVTLSPGLCALLEGRSRFARLGLSVHITASFINPGISNQQVLEIFNASNHPLALIPGTRLCQMVFLRMSGESTYNGIFQGKKNEL